MPNRSADDTATAHMLTLFKWLPVYMYVHLSTFYKNPDYSKKNIKSFLDLSETLDTHYPKSMK